VISPAVLALTASLLAAEPGATVEGKVTFHESNLFQGSMVEGRDAVVFVEHLPAGAVDRTARPAPKMYQRNKAFDPSLLVVQVGDGVAFPNDDKIFHNVFSMSKGREFDLGLYRQGESKSVRFSKAGVAEVFCNIHPQMIGTILVLQNTAYAQVAPDGTFTLPVPPGKHTLVAFWTKSRELVKKEIEAIPGQPVHVNFELAGSGHSERHLNKQGQPYGRYK
jgi:plastocyanin